MEEVLCKDCKWYCTAIKDEPFCNHHHIELVQSACFEGERKVKTNADKIREMSDEELAEVLHNAGGNWYSEEYWLNWLKEEYKKEL